MKSSTITTKNKTVLETAVKILSSKRRSMSPKEIVQAGIDKGLIKVTRGRTEGYVYQIVQSTLHDNAMYSDAPSVERPKRGVYRKKPS